MLYFYLFSDIRHVKMYTVDRCTHARLGTVPRADARLTSPRDASVPRARDVACGARRDIAREYDPRVRVSRDCDDGGRASDADARGCARNAADGV